MSLDFNFCTKQLTEMISLHSTGSISVHGKNNTAKESYFNRRKKKQQKQNENHKNETSVCHVIN